MSNVLNVILKTIQDVQNKNQQSPNVETADPSVFDILRKKVQEIDAKSQNNQVQKGRTNPKSILDMIKDGIEGTKKENRLDNKVATAPKSVFDDLLKKVDQASKRQASTGVKKIIEDYRLDVSRIPPNMLNEIQQKYQGDLKNFNQQYANAIHTLTKKMK